MDVPDAPTQAFLIVKDSKRFPNTGGWGYALFNHDADPAFGKVGRYLQHQGAHHIGNRFEATLVLRQSHSVMV